MKFLYANGCSFTSGYELEPSPDNEIQDTELFQRTYSWPCLLAKALGFDQFRNDSYPGGSNDRIVRTTVDWVLRDWPQMSEKNDLLLIVVGWTDPDRREFFINGQWQQCIPYHNYPQNLELNKINKVYREIAWNEEESGQRFALQVLNLQTFLHSKGIPFLFFDAFSPIYDSTAKFPAFWDPYIHAINEKRYLDFKNPNGGMRARLESRFPKWKGRHPDEAGHLHWAEILSQYAKTSMLIPEQ